MAVHYPQRIDAFNEPAAGGMGGPGRTSFILWKGLAYPDFSSGLQRLGPRRARKHDRLTARRSERLGTRVPRPPVPGKLARSPALWGTNPSGDSPLWSSEGSGLHDIILSCPLGRWLPRWEALIPRKKAVWFCSQTFPFPLYLLAQ